MDIDDWPSFTALKYCNDRAFPPVESPGRQLQDIAAATDLDPVAFAASALHARRMAHRPHCRSGRVPDANNVEPSNFHFALTLLSEVSSSKFILAHCEGERMKHNRLSEEMGVFGPDLLIGLRRHTSRESVESFTQRGLSS